MSLFFFKSILSLYMLIAAFIAMFTMFEIFGKIPGGTCFFVFDYGWLIGKGAGL